MNTRQKDIPTTNAKLELLYNVSRELAAALDLRTVLVRVLFLSMQNVRAITGSILVLDDNGQPVESALIIGDKVHNQTTQQLRITYERGLAGWVSRNRQSVLIPDTSRDERWLRRPDDAEDRTGAKSAVSAPILVRDQLIGVMTLVNHSPGYFNEDHLTLVQAIADQAGIAVLNARLYAESQRQARVMTALADSAAFITASIKLDDVLQRILEQISQALRVQSVTLALIDPRTRELVFHASTDKNSQGVVGMRVPWGQGVVGWVAKEGRGEVVNDVNNDPRFYPVIDQTIGFKTRAVACAPIRSRGEVIGVLEALNPLDGIFDSDALFVLTGIGSLAGTAIRHAQLFERLEAAHQRYRDLFEDSIDPILITDWEGNILEANRQVGRITGIEDEVLKNMNINNLHVVDQDIVGAQFQNLSPGRACSYETKLITHSGHEIPVQVHAREVFIDSVSHLQWILRDITEKINLDSMRNDLISMIYHDLRSPLANIVSSLDVMAAMLPAESDPSYKSLLEIAIRSTERIQRLTNSLLDIRRLEAGQEIGNRQLITPLALAREALDAVDPIAKNKSQEILVNIPPELPEVFVDADMIRRVLINLLENAVKYTPSGSKIILNAQESRDGMQFCVQDNGPGIPPAEHERVFDKFSRLQTKDGPKGLGLGLAYCRLAVESHNGKIWVENVPDSGASFKFVLPIVRDSQKEAVPSQ